MKFNYLLIAFFATFSVAKAQVFVKLYEDTAYLDNLQEHYIHADNDSAKAAAAFQLAYTYKRAKDLPKAKKYLEKGISRAGNNPFLKGASFFYRAYVMLGEPDLKRIKRYALQADSILSLVDHTEAYRLRGQTWVILGALEQFGGNEKKGLDAYINHALPLAKKSGDAFTIAYASKFVGISLLNAEEREKANGYLEEALAEFKNATKESRSLREEAIVEVLLVLAENNMFLGQLEDGKSYLDQAALILKKYPSSNAFLFYYLPEGKYYEKKGQIQHAILSFNKGIALQPKVGENYYINRAKYAKFDLLRKSDRNEEAIAVMQDLLKSDILLVHDRNRYYNLLADTYAHIGNMAEAYQWSQKYIAVNDSLHISQNKADIVALEQKYQTAEKEKQISLLRAEQKEAELTHKNQRLLNWLFGIGTLIFLLALLAALYLHRNKQRQAASQLRELEKQKKLDMTQAMLDGEERERQRLARDLHDGLGGTLSGIKIKLSCEQEQASMPVIDETIIQLDRSIAELRRIARNMMPETLISFGLEAALRDLCISLTSSNIVIAFQPVDIQKDMPVKSQINIYRIIQELLANAIRHGQASEVIVQCIQQGHDVMITVEDNGKGFKKQTATEGIGLSNIQNRVNLMKGKIQIDSVLNEGTSINIELRVV